MLISFKKSLIVEQFQGNYLMSPIISSCTTFQIIFVPAAQN